jgi:hypothetical protein
VGRVDGVHTGIELLLPASQPLPSRRLERLHLLLVVRGTDVLHPAHRAAASSTRPAPRSPSLKPGRLLWFASSMGTDARIEYSPARCSFCGRSRKAIVAGGTADLIICSACVRLCVEVLSGQGQLDLDE